MSAPKVTGLTIYYENATVHTTITHMAPDARLALARALVPECAVVPREDAADHIEAVDMWLGDNADETPASVWGSINILRAMLAAGEATP